MKNPLLYENKHPNTSLKGTGYKNKQIAEKTIKLISKRSLKYQFDVINTMYNRAKYHKNQTKEMKDAMNIYKKWLKEYKKKKNIEDKKYPFLNLETIIKYEKLADEYNVSKVARGIEKGKRTDIGFEQILKNIKGKYYKLQYIPIKNGKSEGEDYWSYRINFIKSRLGQMKKMNTPLYYENGKYIKLPTKQYVILIMHGYSPDKKLN
jgi:hypothetical protein